MSERLLLTATAGAPWPDNQNADAPPGTTPPGMTPVAHAAE